MKNISFTNASKNIKYYKETIKGNAQNLYFQNKTLHLRITGVIGIKNKTNKKQHMKTTTTTTIKHC